MHGMHMGMGMGPQQQQQYAHAQFLAMQQANGMGGSH
jgi:hypothetical protein